MAKDVIISTGAVNCYGTRVLTEGIDLSQYERNPVLLWMHRRAFDGDAMPIGKVENLRVEDGKLIGTPVFDQNDDFARQIESKWESGFLRMASAALEPIETSADDALVLPGQTRETVTRSKLVEVSIVDIGGNDEALQLCGADGKLMKLAAGEDAPDLPLLQLTKEDNPEADEAAGEENNKPQNQTTAMNKEQLTLLGLPEGASDEQATAALQLMKTKADSAETLQLAAVTQCVDQAIADRKIVAEQRDHFIKLGKSAGAEMLADTFKAMPAQAKPNDTLNLSRQSAPGAGAPAPKSYTKLSEVPQGELLTLRKDQPAEYMRLYKAEYGTDCPALSE
ncbi:MAG: phage protease [Muribaculaceae bacterium]|nr:phage protease [Muribaculaceae bacterium]